MFCSGCGQALAPGQGFCPQCGRSMAVGVPSVPGLGFQLASYAGKIRALSIVWFIYAGLSLAVSFMGMAFVHAFMNNRFGPGSHRPWIDGPFRPEWFGPAFLHFIWLFVALRTALLFAAAWGLMERAPWGRMVAIVAAVLCLIKPPFGTVLGIWTLVMLLGYRNQALYEQLP
jgi:hypothetical protein